MWIDAMDTVVNEKPTSEGRAFKVLGSDNA